MVAVKTIETYQLMSYCKIVAVGSEIETKHVNELCGQNRVYER
jgi:hypothetical protein